MTSLRATVLKHIERSTDLTLQLQQHRTRSLDQLMRLATLMGDIEFYVVLLPLLRWIGVPLGFVSLDFAYRFTALLLCSALVAGVIKDVGNLPRPPHNRVWTSKVELDRGFVSSHSMNAAALSFFTLASVWARLGDLQLVAVAVALFWSLAVAFSRFYNGAHSYPDIIAGYSLGIVFGFLVASDDLESFSVGWTPAIFSATVALFHPRPPTVTASRAISLAFLLLGLAVAYELDRYDWSESSVAVALARVPRQEISFLLHYWDHCSTLYVATTRLLVGGIAFAVGTVASTQLNHLLEPFLPLRAIDALTRKVALPTFPYVKQTAIQKQSLDAVESRTLRRVPLSFLVMWQVFWAIPLLLSSLKMTNKPLECSV